jgi:predicted phosphodiesterase
VTTQRILLMPDLHAPALDEAAFSCFLDVLARWKPDVLVCLGDFIDLACVSTYAKDPRTTASLQDEIEGARKARARVDKAAGKATKVFLMGNHEARLESYLIRQAPEVIGFVSVRELLQLHANGWKVVDYKSTFQLGHLRMSHDYGRAGVNAARQSCVDVGESVAFGHTHRLQVHYQGTQAGARHVGASLGWLGDPEAVDYRHRDLVRRDWQHGFGVVHMLKDKRFWLQAVPIVGGQCVVDGVVYGKGSKR